jgi:hypothetical protein
VGTGSVKRLGGAGGGGCGGGGGGGGNSFKLSFLRHQSEEAIAQPYACYFGSQETDQASAPSFTL